MKIRKATIKDFKDIQRLNAELFIHDYKFDKTLDLEYPFKKKGSSYYKEALTNKKYVAFIAEENETAVGYAIGVYHGKKGYRKDVSLAEVDNIFVEKGERQKGLGKRLVAEIKKWAKAKGANYFRVNAYSKNINAIAFYKKSGFKVFETILEEKIT